MRNLIYLLLGFGLLNVLMLSCSKTSLGEADQSKRPIVTVLEHTLYMSDIENITHYGMSAEDSAKVVNDFVKMWVNDKLLYDKAKENIRQSEIESLVENYRKSLIVNEYQAKLLQERLSKTVSEKNLFDFFEQNKEQFNLTENIIQGLYLKIPKTSPQLENFRKWYKQGTEVAVEQIEKNTLQNAIGYEYFFDKWVSMDQVMANIPKTVSDVEGFLKKNKELESQDSTFVYLLYVKNYKLLGSEAPYEYVKDDLQSIYRESQRDKFIKELQSDLYNKALANEQIKYYIK